MSLIVFSLAVVNTAAWLLPAPADKLGWGLRIRPLEYHPPYLAKERIWHTSLEVVLVNQTSAERKYLLLEAACNVGDLDVTIIRANGKPLHSYHRLLTPILFSERWSLPAQQAVVAVFKFEEFGYHYLLEPGVYELRASLKTTQGVIFAPVVKLKVIEPSSDAILASQPVPLEGYQTQWPKAKQETAVMQQIKLGDRVWLIYRQFLSPKLGGKVSATFRLAELPGKVEMKMEGAYGDGKPLTITYKDANSPTGTTKLVINSTDGKPWTEEDERALRERTKLKPITPAP